MSNVPELTTPADDELRVQVIDPGVPVPDDSVGDGVAPELVEVNHPDSMARVSSDVQPPTAGTTTWEGFILNEHGLLKSLDTILKALSHYKSLH